MNVYIYICVCVGRGEKRGEMEKRDGSGSRRMANSVVAFPKMMSYKYGT